MHRISNIKYLLFIPSFYGFLSLTCTYLIFILDVIDYSPVSYLTHTIILLAIFAFLVSTIVFYKLNKLFLINFIAVKIKLNRIILILLYSISFLGAYLYLKEFFDYYGGYTNYFLVLFSDTSSELRSNGQIASESVGIQLTYFGWIAIAVSFYEIVNCKSSKLWWIPLILTFSCNVLFIDRTRPMWILLVVLYILFVSVHKNIKFSRLLMRGSIFIACFFSLFVLIGNLAGKISKEKQYIGWDISPSSQDIVFYLTSSYFYLDYIIVSEIPDYKFDRTIYPALKGLKVVGIIDQEPSSLINDFHGHPYKTNVGTFLEPFYRDGGFIYMIFGVVLHSVILNYWALIFLKIKSVFSLFLVSNVCVINFFSFFTPKLNNFPIWFFFSIGFIIVICKLMIKNEK